MRRLELSMGDHPDWHINRIAWISAESIAD
jgi:hypothetical protein